MEKFKMKRILTLSVILAIIALTSGIAISKDQEKAAKSQESQTPPSQAQMLREKTKMNRMQNMNPEERMKRMQERKTEEIKKAKKQPQALIKKLKAIKALAIKEKAKDTAVEIDKLIDSTKQQMDKKLAKIEERHARVQKMITKGTQKSQTESEKSLKAKKNRDVSKKDKK